MNDYIHRLLNSTFNHAISSTNSSLNTPGNAWSKTIYASSLGKNKKGPFALILSQSIDDIRGQRTKAFAQVALHLS